MYEEGVECDGCVQDVPYHNSTHAADVTLSMNSLLATPALEVQTITN